MSKSNLPFGIDLDEDVTVKLWQNGSASFLQEREDGKQDEVIISKEGMSKLIEWLNKHVKEPVPENCHELHREWMKLYNFCPECGADVRPLKNPYQSVVIGDDPTIYVR